MRITFKDEADLHRWFDENDPFSGRGQLIAPCFSVVWKKFVFPYLKAATAKVGQCTRLHPHVCGSNGPCNGLPNEVAA